MRWPKVFAACRCSRFPHFPGAYLPAQIRSRITEERNGLFGAGARQSQGSGVHAFDLISVALFDGIGEQTGSRNEKNCQYEIEQLPDRPGSVDEIVCRGSERKSPHHAPALNYCRVRLRYFGKVALKRAVFTGGKMGVLISRTKS